MKACIDDNYKKNLILPYNLQWFADGEGGEKTEPATQKKLEELEKQFLNYCLQTMIENVLLVINQETVNYKNILKNMVSRIFLNIPKEKKCSQ